MPDSKRDQLSRDEDGKSERRKRDREDRHRRHHRDKDREQKRHSRDRSRDKKSEDGKNRHGEKRERSSRKRKGEEETDRHGASAQALEGDDEDFMAKKRKSNPDDIMTRTGGAYIPPARLRMMQAQITDKTSQQYQRIAWEALKKSINGLINKVNVSNITQIVQELFQENIVRGRGVLTRSMIQAQAASPTFTHVYAALTAIINTKFPQIGELILKRIVLQFRKGFKRNDKGVCLSSVRFVAHLVNQQVAHEIIALEILTLLLETPTSDSVEVSVGFLKESGQKLTDLSPRGITAIFDRLRSVLHEGHLDIRVNYMIEVMFATRKDGFKEYPAVLEELDLVQEADQFTHMLTLEDAVNGEEMLNVFKFDPEYEETENKYKVLKREILDESSDEEGSGSGSDSDSDSSDSEGEAEGAESQPIIDQTETNMIALRRTIYLTIQSSLDFEECAHKLLKLELKPGQEVELANMILDCCGQMRTYEKFYGLLAQRFCMLDRKYITPFVDIFKEQYETCYRLETNKLRNIAKFFSHLLHTDAISWEVLQNVRLTEEDTTSSSRIFIKILFQELCEFMGLPKLNDRLKDQTLAVYFEGLFPRDNPKNTRFAINFFTSIGLGGLTDELRAHLKTMPRPTPQQLAEPNGVAVESDSSSDSSSSDEDSSSGSSSSSDSSSSSSESEEEEANWKRKKKVEKSKSSSQKSNRPDRVKSKKRPKEEKQSVPSDTEDNSSRHKDRSREGRTENNGRNHDHRRSSKKDKHGDMDPSNGEIDHHRSKRDHGKGHSREGEENKKDRHSEKDQDHDIQEGRDRDRHRPRDDDRREKRRQRSS